MGVDSLYSDVIAEELGLVGSQPRFLSAVCDAMRCAEYGANFLIEGASGSGKLSLALAVQKLYSGAAKLCPVLDCNRSGELMEAELLGRFMHTVGNTSEKCKSIVDVGEESGLAILVLRQVDKLPTRVQGDLAEALEKGESRYGQKFDHVRVIGTVTGSADSLVDEEKFSKKLRSVFAATVRMPELGERRSDIIPLVKHFLERWNVKSGRQIGIDYAALLMLKEFDWRDNISELKGVVEEAAMLSDGSKIRAAGLPLRGAGGLTQATGSPELKVGFNLNRHLEEIKRQYVSQAIKESKGVQAAAARMLGCSPQVLQAYLKKNSDLVG